MKRKYDVAAYVWPSYTGDEPRTRMFWPEGIGEWQTVRSAAPKFDGHLWPRKPVWGYVNEADRYVMEMQIDAAADHGVNVFIYDWYWYDRRPFLENCLNEGYLKARNNDRVKFYLMWANHDAHNDWDKRINFDKENLIWGGAVDRAEFERIAFRLIEKYFKHPSYYCIDGKPVFEIYELALLMKGLGGLEGTTDALHWFRNQVVRAGLPGLHLQSTLWSEKGMNLAGVEGCSTLSTKEILHQLGFDSLTHYQFCHFADIDRDYNDIMVDVQKEWKRADESFGVPYFPHISLGWDNNPRFIEFKHGIIRNNTPENVRKALEKARDYADAHPGQPGLITINSWNEWTESSYLQPDSLYGYGYLEAVKEVFL